jgi:tetratricopeptide (TPR) repeat protein
MSAAGPAAAARAHDLLRQAGELHRLGRVGEAIPLFQQSLALAPEVAEGWNELAYALHADGRHAEAVEAFGRALAQQVERPHEAHLQRAVLFADHLRRDDDAHRELQDAIALQPDYLPALLNLGNLHEQRGERASALACYDRILADASLAQRSDATLRWVALARSAIMRPAVDRDDPLLGRLQAAADAAGSNHHVRANLLFALGQCLDRIGDYAQAFEAFAKGNRCLMRQSGRLYDRQHAVRLTDAFIAAFPDARARVDATARAGATPLFICGMFRSGSTLLEQVLAAHPQVVAGGERDWLLRTAAQRMAPFPASMARLDAAREAALADEYAAHLAALFPAAASGMYITDKRPDNFLLIGLIKRLFPAARIVHTIRNPLDNGLSVFMQHLNLQVAAYAGDLGDIGHYYGEYRRLMAHWKSLHADSIFDFDYDAFVRDPRPALERLFGFLGLDWDERCMEFHAQRSTVKTASYWQVRRPLYGEASGRWRNYRDNLGPLVQALRAAGVEIPEAPL